MAKIRQFSWCELNIWPSPITSGNFRKNKADLLKRFENVNCAYYRGLRSSQKWGSFDGITWKFELPFHKLKFLQKYPIFNVVIWTFELLPLSWGITFSNKRQFWWCPLKIWPSPIITKWNCRENRTALMSALSSSAPIITI